MSDRKQNNHSSKSHHISAHNDSKNGKVQDESLLPSQPTRPMNDNRDDWSAYWQAHNQPWRTEPEIRKERQEELARHRAIPVDIEKGIYPFGGMKLDRDDVEWLLATHENGLGPVDWNDEEQRDREGLDLRGADLRSDGSRRVDLSSLPLACLQGALIGIRPIELFKEPYVKALIQLKGVNLSKADLRDADLSGVDLSGADLSEANLSEAVLGDTNLSNANFRRSLLEDAYLSGANLKGANFASAKLKGADLTATNLEETWFYYTELNNVDFSVAKLKNPFLSGSILDRADFTEAMFEKLDLYNVSFSDECGVAPFLADVQWGATNLALVDWSQVFLLSEEHVARQKIIDGEEKTKERHLEEYQRATRANRQLAVALLEQGLNEGAVRFAYHANALQRRVYWYQIFVTKIRKGEKEPTAQREVLKKRLAVLRQRVQLFGSYIFSLFLDILAGYGYKPERTVGWYLLVVFGFALAYALFGHLPFWPDALVYSLTSFHGRGFLPNLDGQVVTLHYPLVVMAAFEAVIGLLIEVSFIATFTQRFFGK